MKYTPTPTDHCASPSLPSWERGLKLSYTTRLDASKIVAPLVGAWIEISSASTSPTNLPSLPSWERGLKFTHEGYAGIYKVAPLVGAWIEIGISGRLSGRRWSLPSWERGLKSYTDCPHTLLEVAPLVGAWIEIVLFRCILLLAVRRSPRGSVD